ncbi:hypothetical protein AAC03nite_02740 [Alicyclobacillus acidoterrestris]|uniref:UxaA family hydrolase n=1 Tax=Alicyclobacillus suci TaxID=2816080 RepID=UPI001195B811|nr:UxaA family hydrolase [Alicyclobacillus suci]GEO24489.1 hypothetical protein AAC03nite_02740 [Alicyclobacillus acidoterrestris]
MAVEQHVVAGSMQKRVLVIDVKDNVAVALEDIKKGDHFRVETAEGALEITALVDIPFGHKVALKSFVRDEPVLKYGEEIGKAAESIEIGDWVHNHNMYCERGFKYGR